MNHETEPGIRTPVGRCKSLHLYPPRCLSCEQSALAELSMRPPADSSPNLRWAAARIKALPARADSIWGKANHRCARQSRRAETAVGLVRTGTAELLMKEVSTRTSCSRGVARDAGLATGRRISHVFLIDVPTYHKILMSPIGNQHSAVAGSRLTSARTQLTSRGISACTAEVAILAAVETSQLKDRPLSMPRHFARWRIATSISGGLLDGRWPLTTRSASMPRGPRASIPK